MDYVRIYTDNPSPKEIERVAAVLRDGGIIVYPTDTLYAIGCDALNVRAVERICRLKNIDTRKALLSIVCPDLSMLSQYAKVSNAHFKLMRRNLPGAFTFILPTSSQLPHIYKNRKTVYFAYSFSFIAYIRYFHKIIFIFFNRAYIVHMYPHFSQNSHTVSWQTQCLHFK